MLLLGGGGLLLAIGVLLMALRVLMFLAWFAAGAAVVLGLLMLATGWLLRKM